MTTKEYYERKHAGGEFGVPGSGALSGKKKKVDDGPSWIKLVVEFVVEALRAWRLWKKKGK